MDALAARRWRMPELPANDRWLRPFVVVAWLGVLTTAANTIVPAIVEAGVAGATAEALRAVRLPVLLAHSLATLFPMLGLALVGLRVSPFAAVVAAAVISIEKLLELVGFALRVFPPEESFGGIAVSDVVAAAWDQLYFVLWTCNTIGAAAAGWMMWRLAPGARGKAFAAFAWSASATTLLMIAGPDYLAWPVPAPPMWLFFVLFTGYRVAIALALGRAQALAPAARTAA
ncbi:MAG TPA: hypothetical protein VFL14_06315 [Xanthomonadales bacterium]|nr:hypothetical protein [Xanthomonadales bacterium]